MDSSVPSVPLPCFSVALALGCGSAALARPLREAFSACYDRHMGTTSAISVEEYLATSYPDGDREYVEGRIVERNVGEHLHARIQLLIGIYLGTRYGQFWSGVECRVRISAQRFRIPDVCLITGKWPGPERGPLTEAPFLAVEVLSPDDRAGDMQERIDDYLAAGVKYVWVVNPERKRGYIHTPEGSHEAKDGVLRTEDPKIEMPLAELFQPGA